LKVRFRVSFAKDLRTLKDKGLVGRIRAQIGSVETAETLAEVVGLKKLRGGGEYYRIRVGDYRVGLVAEENVVVFVRVLHHRGVYRYSP
jgi:mRNA interferase RelE/StbE